MVVLKTSKKIRKMNIVSIKVMQERNQNNKKEKENVKL
jgi:hypothetical protein